MLSIGEFSRICQVSVKTLHHYDKIGLLKPARVDHFTGYRYYDRQQLEKMLLIQRFKRYGFSLEEIHALLICPEEHVLFSKLQQQLEKLNQQREETALVISELSSHLANFERTGNIMDYQNNYEIQLVETISRPVLSCRRNMGVEEYGKYYGALYEKAAKDHIALNGLTGALYYDEEFHHEGSDIELFLGVREPAKASRILEGCLCAKTSHKGPYSSLSDAYGALTTWIVDNGYKWCGAPYDIYVSSGQDNLPPTEWITEVYFPVRKR